MADEAVNGEPPSERSKISLLEDNSLETGTGNFIAQNREFIKTSREFAASCRELSAGCGKFPGRATDAHSSTVRRDSRVETRVKI